MARGGRYARGMMTGKETSRHRLATEAIGWLTTVSGGGVPSTAPVWFFLEDDDTITVYSKDPSVRVRNVDENDRVTLHLDGDGHGGAIVVVNASAIVDRSDPGAAHHAGFVAKYQPYLDRYGWSPEWFAKNYPTCIRLTMRSIRGN